MKMLRRFGKVYLAPGKSKVLRYRLRNMDFSFVGRDMERHTEPGRMAVMVGGLKKDFYLKKE